MVRRLLILMCSESKRATPELLPAQDRYRGPLWQMLGLFRRQQPDEAAHIDVFAISAALGLIPATQAITDYDQKMTAARAAELQEQTLARFQELMHREYAQLCLGLSQVYLPALTGWKAIVPACTEVTITDGPIGTKKAQLRAWLEQREWVAATPPQRLLASAQPRGKATVAGVQLQMSRDEVFERVRSALATDPHGADRYQKWYVLIYGQKIAPKWLVSKLSGRPTTAFDASAARKVLVQLGIDVERCAEG